MKKIFILGSFLLLCSICRANATGQNVQEVISSSITVNTVSVSSSAATQIDPDSILLSGRTVLEIQNKDSSYAIYCSQNSNVTTSSGRMITSSGGTWVINLMAVSASGRMKIYCITANASASSSVAVTQAY